MVVFGLLSLVFHVLTLSTLRLGFHARKPLFATSSFIESASTELAVTLALPTN